MTTYLVPAGFGEAEYIEKRSRFIGRVWPVADEAQALEHLREIREQHWDAKHNVYAYIIREGGIMRYSDDGEPGGTSGMPTLNVFRSEEIQNVCCVITRYFGGVLLGSGGLVRAYSNTAKMALDAAGISRMASWQKFSVKCAYSQYEKLRRVLEDGGAIVENTDYSALVEISSLAREDEAEALLVRLRDASAGGAEISLTGTEFRGVRIK